MPSPFEPIVKLRTYETFVSDSEQTSIVANTFISASLMFVAMLITWLFIWSYQKDRYLFIAMFAVVALLYGVEMVILTSVNSSELQSVQYKLFMSSSILFSAIFFLVGVFGFFKYYRRNVGSYVPTTVQNYLN